MQMWDETSSRIYYANRTLNVSQWERPPGATFAPPPTAETPQQPGTAAAALGGGAIPVPADIKLRQFLRHLVKAPDGSWVRAAHPTEPTQRKKIATDMITALAAQFLAATPEEIRQQCVTEDALPALGSSLLSGVNWHQAAGSSVTAGGPTSPQETFTHFPATYQPARNFHAFSCHLPARKKLSPTPEPATKVSSVPSLQATSC